MNRLINSRWGPFCGVFLLFLIVGLIQLRDLNGMWSTWFVGSGELEGWLWRFWWMKKMLVEAWTSSASWKYALWVSAVAGCYPETGNLFDLEVMSWPLELLFGYVLHYNIKCLLVLTLNGVCGYYLGRQWLNSRAGALACALVIAISPYSLYEISIGRIRQAIIFPLILYVFYLCALWRRPCFANMAWTGFWGAITSAFYLYYGMAAFFFTVIFIGWGVVSPAYGRINVRRLLFGILAGVLALIGTFPFVSSYVERSGRGQHLPEMMWGRDFLTLEELTSPNIETVLKQNDPLLNSLQRFRTDSLPWQYAFMPHYSRCLPWMFSALALLAWPLAFVKREQSDNSCRPGALLPWAAGMVFFYVLTLGPYIKDGFTGSYVAYDSGGIASPYIILFKYVPAFARLFSPVRMSAMMLICAGILAGACTRKIFDLLRFPAFLKGVYVALLAIISLHSLNVCGALPLPTSRIEIPDYYYQLAKEKRCCIAEIPFRTGDSLQYYQIAHEQKLLLGWSDGATPPGFPPGDIEFYTKRIFEGKPQNTFLDFMEALNVKPEDPGLFTEEDYNYVVRDSAVHYAVIHERGCYQISPENGSSHYQKILDAMEKHFGAPVAYSKEYVYGRDNQPQEFNMAVFQLI
ncbi:hypothetical protein IJT17_07510 [bacterium]|nr:hypothetical protein [bacterium]